MPDTYRRSCAESVFRQMSGWKPLAIDLWDAEKREKIEELQWEFGQELLRKGLTVIIEWGTWGRSERDALRLRARELGATVELHYLRAPFEVLFERTQRRGIEGPPISREQLLGWAEAFQAPTPEEFASYDNSATVEVQSKPSS